MSGVLDDMMNGASVGSVLGSFVMCDLVMSVLGD